MYNWPEHAVCGFPSNLDVCDSFTRGSERYTQCNTVVHAMDSVLLLESLRTRWNFTLRKLLVRDKVREESKRASETCVILLVLNTIPMECNYLALMGVLEHLNGCLYLHGCTGISTRGTNLRYCCMGALKQCWSLLQNNKKDNVKFMTIKKFACTINYTSTWGMVKKSLLI